MISLTIEGNLLLNNGIEIPWVGLGVSRSPPGKDTRNAVLSALETGYRHMILQKYTEMIMKRRDFFKALSGYMGIISN